MATITLARSDLFPIGTTVGIYPAGARNPGHPPGSAAITSAAVDAAGLLTVTNAGITAGSPYVAYASVSSEHRYAICKSTVDTFDAGTAAGTADTTSGNPALANVAATSGAFAVGQAITGSGIPGGTRLVSGSGASWVMSAAATANATGVALVAYGARAPIVQLGTAVSPQTQASRWQARVAQRRNLIGTS